jgi:acyl-CoA reductase-like NAD-dependent aldehyde dehydrogenase
VKEAAEKFSKLFAQNVESEVVGDPMNSKTTIGPLVRESQRQTLVNQVEDAKSKTARY